MSWKSRLILLALSGCLVAAREPSQSDLALSCAERAALATSPRASHAGNDKAVMALLKTPGEEKAAIEWLLDRFEPLLTQMCHRFGFFHPDDIAEVRARYALSLWEKRLEYDPERTVPSTWVGNLAFYAAGNLRRARNLEAIRGSSLTASEEAGGPGWETVASPENTEGLDHLVEKEEERRVREYVAALPESHEDRTFLAPVLNGDRVALTAQAKGRKWLPEARAIHQRVEAHGRLPLGERAWLLFRRKQSVPEVAELLDVTPEEALYLIDTQYVTNTLRLQRGPPLVPEMVVIPDWVLHQSLSPMDRTARQMIKPVIQQQITTAEQASRMAMLKPTLDAYSAQAMRRLADTLGRPGPVGRVYLRVVPQDVFDRSFGAGETAPLTPTARDAQIRGWQSGGSFYVTENELRTALSQVTSHHQSVDRRDLQSKLLLRAIKEGITAQALADQEGLTKSQVIHLLGWTAGRLGPFLRSDRRLNWTQIQLIDDTAIAAWEVNRRAESWRRRGVERPDLVLTEKEFDTLCRFAFRRRTAPSALQLCEALKSQLRDFQSGGESEATTGIPGRQIAEALRDLTQKLRPLVWIPDLETHDLVVVNEVPPALDFLYLDLPDFNRLLLQVPNEDTRLVARLHFEYRYSIRQVAQILNVSATSPPFRIRSLLPLFSQHFGRPIAAEFIAVRHPRDESYAPVPSLILP